MKLTLFQHASGEEAASLCTEKNLRTILTKNIIQTHPVHIKTPTRIYTLIYIINQIR